MVSSSVHESAASRAKRSTSRAASNGCAIRPPTDPSGRTVGERRRHAKSAPPAAPHQIRLRAVAHAADRAIRRHQLDLDEVVGGQSEAAMSHPSPPPRVRPAMPVLETAPRSRPGRAGVSRQLPHRTPPWARAVCAPGSTRMSFIRARSIMRPPSSRATGQRVPAPRTDTSSPASPARRTASATSAVPGTAAMSEGRLLINPLWIRRASSGSRVPGGPEEISRQVCGDLGLTGRRRSQSSHCSLLVTSTGSVGNTPPTCVHQPSGFAARGMSRAHPRRRMPVSPSPGAE